MKNIRGVVSVYPPKMNDARARALFDTCNYSFALANHAKDSWKEIIKKIDTCKIDIDF